MDSYTETKYTGYGENIGNSFKGMVFGVVLIVGSIVLLWWNEGRSLKQANALKEMHEKIITLPDTAYNSAYESQAILVQGLVKPLSKVIDEEFNVQSDGLVLQKEVQMYQWRENKSTRSEDKLGGGTETITTYDYVKEWSNTHHNSSSFKYPSGHTNPSMHYKSQTFSTPATLGEYQLDRAMVSHIGASTPFDGLDKMPPTIGVAQNHKSFLYIGQGVPNSPQIGDVKIRYFYAPSSVYSFACSVSNKSLAPYHTSNGKSFVFVRSGKVPASVIFEEELSSNALLTWILRGVGLLIMFIGFNAIIAPLSVLAKVIPMLGDVVCGIGGFFSAILTLIVGSLVIALAWFSARPLLALGVIGGAIVLSFVLGKIGNKKKSLPPQEEEESKPRASTPPPRQTPPPRG